MYDRPGLSILENLKRLGNHERIAIFIRHSERENGPAEDPNLPLERTLQLTENGRRLAFEFGEALFPYDRIRLSHTIMPRCEDTAEMILKGFRKAYPNKFAELLGHDPRIGLMRYYALNLDARNELRAKLGHNGFIRAWLNNELPPEVMPKINKAINAFLGDLWQELDYQPMSTLQIMIGHDTELVLLREYLLGYRFEESPWVDFLDGLIFVWNKDKSLNVSWRNRMMSYGIEV